MSTGFDALVQVITMVIANRQSPYFFSSRTITKFHRFATLAHKLDTTSMFG
jgi:hypothetical protein